MALRKISLVHFSESFYMMTNYFTILADSNSGPEYWQTEFEKRGENFRRIDQQESESSEW